MKLLIYSHFFAPSIGGVEAVVLSLAQGLAQYRTADGPCAFEITLVTQTQAGNFQDNDLPFRVIRQPGALQLFHLIRQADVVHIAGAALAPLLWGLLARIPVVVEHHGFQTICPTGQLFQEPENIPCPGHFMAGRYGFCLRCRTDGNRLGSFRLWLLTFFRRFLCNHVAVNIAPTSWLRELLQLSRTEVIPHGLEPIPALVPISTIHTKPVLVFVGRLVTTKGVRVLLEAARLLLQQGSVFQVLIVGDGPDRASLETLARDWQLTSHVCFLGRLPDSQVSETLASASAVIVPSLGGEVFGMVVAENMLRGLPVIASDLGSFSEVLGEMGLTFVTGDSVDLARQIAKVLDDRSSAQRLGAAARRRVLEIFGLSRMIDGHIAIYRRIAEKRDTR